MEEKLGKPKLKTNDVRGSVKVTNRNVFYEMKASYNQNITDE